MQLTPETSDMTRYLASSEIIDFENLDIQETAVDLSKGITDEIQLIKTVYEFVRDNISHSIDIGSNEVTYRAFENLRFSMFEEHSRRKMQSIFRCIKNRRFFNVPQP